MSKNKICIPINNQIRKIAEQIQGETPKSVSNLITTYYDYHNIDPSIDDNTEYPSAEELTKFRDSIRGKAGESDKSFEEYVNKSSKQEAPKIPLKEQKQQLYRDFSAKEKQDRVNLVSDLFSDVLDSMMQEEEDLYNEQIRQAQKEGDTERHQALILSKGKMTRQSLITKYTPQRVFERVKETFTDFMSMSAQGQVEYLIQELEQKDVDGSQEELQKLAIKYAAARNIAFQKILNNFEQIAFESTRNLQVTENIRFSPDFQVLEENSTREIDENGETLFNSEDAFELEEEVKEGWMNQFREVSASQSLSQEVKKYIASVQKTDLDGNFELDDLGYQRKLDPAYVHATLLDALSGISTPDDLMQRLTKLSETKPWVDKILIDLEMDELEETSSEYSDEENKEIEEYNKEIRESNDASNVLKSKFFKNYNKDFSYYWVQITRTNSKGVQITRTIPVNKPNGIFYLLSSWRDNYSAGYKLSNNSIYDTNANLIKEKARTQFQKLQVLQQYLNKNKNTPLSDIFEYESEQFNTLVDLLQSVGVDINDTDLFSTILDSSFSNKKSNIIPNLLSSLGTIFRGVVQDKVKDTTDEDGTIIRGDLLNEFNKAYETMAKELSDLNDNAIEASFRENGKSYFSFTSPNLTKKTINKLKDVMNDPEAWEEYIYNTYLKYDWFQESSGEILNHWLHEIYTDKNARELLDHKVLLNRDKIEYSDQTPFVYSKALLTEYFSDPNAVKNPNNAYAWYYIPVMSDASTSEFIKFKRYTKDGIYKIGNREVNYKEYLMDKFSNIVSQEYNRMLDVADVFIGNLKGEDTKTIQNIDIKLDTSKISKSEIDALIEQYETDDSVSKVTIVQEFLKKHAKDYKESIGGLEFKFLPLLNNDVQIDGKPVSIFQILNISNVEGSGTVLRETLTNILDNMFQSEFEKEYKLMHKLGLFETNQKGDLINFPGVKSDKQVNKKLINSLEEVKKLYKPNGHWLPQYDTLLKNLNSGTPTILSTIDKILYHLKRDLSSKAMQDKRYDKLHSRVIDNLFFTSELRDNVEEYYLNSSFATSQIIQILATDLAYFKNAKDFQKRFKMYYSPAERLNTDSKYGRTIERSIYINDQIISAPTFNQIEEIFSKAVKDGRITVAQKVAALSHYVDIEATDGQAYRSPFSMRAVMDMAGEWTPELERAFQNFKEGKFDARDLEVIVQPIKQFTASNVTHELSNGSVRRVPTQHKNSELLLMSSFLMAGVLNKSPQLRALMDFLEESFDPNNPDSGIDVIQFKSAVKVGGQGIVDIMDLNDYQEIKDRLKQAAYYEDGSFNPEVIHEIPYEEYGIQVATPDHHLDMQQLIGTQLRKLVPANMHPDTLIKIPGKKEPVKFSEWFKEYNKAIVSNVIKSYEETEKFFQDKESVEDLLLDEILSNDRYGMDLYNACKLEEVQNPDGSITKDFTVPLFDPAQVNRTMSLINSIIKSRITKQKIKGGSLIQATNFGYTEDLQIRYHDSEGNLILNKQEFIDKYKPSNSDQEFEQYLIDHKANNIAYLEAYMPWYSKEYLEPLMNKNNQLDADNLPEDLRRLIGYRVPTEDAYSMFPIRIKGFTPPQNGGIIMLPSEIVTMSGSDFDIDKLYIFLPEFNIQTIDHRRAKADFIQANKGNNELLTAILGEQEFSENEEYQEFLKINKDKYELEKPRISKIKYKEELGLKNSKAAFNNRFIDLMWEKMTHEQTASRSLKPGGFENVRESASLMRIVNGVSFEELKSVFPNIKNYKDAAEAILKANKEQKKILGEITMGNINPLSPSTQLKFQEQNMTGKKLVAIFAVHNSHNALMQHTNLSIKPNENSIIVLNGKQYIKLNAIKNERGEFIANNVASLLAAAVDNAKDPLLSFLNLNIDTANAGSLLIRLGYSTTEVGALFNQPIIKEAYRMVSDSKHTLPIEIAMSLIGSRYNVLIDNLGKESEGIPSIVSEDYLLNELIESSLLGKNIEELSYRDKVGYLKGQLRVLDLYKNIHTVGKDLSDLSSVHKADTQSGGAGPSISHTINKLLDIQKVYDKIDDGKFNLSHAAEIIDLDIPKDLQGQELLDRIMESPVPFLQGFFTLGLQRTEGMLNKYFPFYRKDFQDVITDITSKIKSDKINPKIMNDIFNDMLAYYLQKEEFFGDQEGGEIQGREKRKAFVNKFPDYFKLKFENNPILQQNEFMKRLNYNKPDKLSSVPYITFKNVGSLDQRLKDELGLSWESLLYSENDDARKMGYALIKYSYFRNGFAFGPQSFMHLINTNIKQNIPGYISSLRELGNNQDDFTLFTDQFFRNNLDNRALVPQIDSQIPATFSKTKNKMVMYINKENQYKFYPILKYGLNKDGDNVTTGYVKYMDGNIPYYYKMYSQKGDKNSAEIQFIRVEPLGILNQVKEFEYGKPNIRSVIKNNSVDNLVNQEQSTPIVDRQTISDNVQTKDNNKEAIQNKVDQVESLHQAVEKVLGDASDIINDLITSEKKSLKDINTENNIKDDEGNPICK